MKVATLIFLGHLALVYTLPLDSGIIYNLYYLHSAVHGLVWELIMA